jgi:dihydroxy-acid dehydratase
MPLGRYKGERLDWSSMGKYFVIYRQGKISKEELREVEGAVCPGPGACCLMGTANSMCIASEALGLSLPGNSALCATDPALEKPAEEAGRKVMELLGKDMKARDIMRPAAFTNAVKVCCATSGSTNLTLHFPEIAVPWSPPGTSTYSYFIPISFMESAHVRVFSGGTTVSLSPWTIMTGRFAFLILPK